MNISNNITTTFPDRFAVVNLDNQDEFVLVESYLRFATEEEIMEDFKHFPQIALAYIETYKDFLGKGLSDYNLDVGKSIFSIIIDDKRIINDIRLLKKEYIMVGEEKQEIINTESGDVMIEVDTEEEQVTIWDSDGDSVTLSFDEMEEVYGEYSDHLILEYEDEIPY